MTITIWTHHGGSFGGISPSGEREFVDAIERHGHAIVRDSSHREPVNHRIAGVGLGHDDALFCEAGTSHAAFVENGEAFGGRWWEDTDSPFSNGVKHFGCEDRSRFGRVGGRTPESAAIAAA
jgi:hypothetical protein